jgi:glycosyltransferase involved in cell wall biosynthesis
MHVLITANDLFPDPGAGGSGRYVHEVGTRLVDRGHRVSVVTRKRGDASDRGTVAGMDVYRYDASIPRLPSTLWALSRIARRIDSDYPVDLLNFHGPLSSFGVDRALANDRPRVATFHSPWPAEYRLKTSNPERLGRPWQWLSARGRWTIERRMLESANATVTLSQFMRDRLDEAYPEAPDGPVVPGGSDVSRFRPDPADGTPAAMDAEGESSSFLTVRRLTPRMGFETLISAFTTVDSESDAHLYVGGDGPLRPELEAQTERLGIGDSVTFLGFVPEDELPAAYAAADAFVLPTTALEGFGLATVEALAAGTPVIGTTAGATPELLGPLETELDTELLVEDGDTEALADRMGEWATLPTDRIDAAGEACRRYAEANYKWESVVDSVESLFRDSI